MEMKIIHIQRWYDEEFLIHNRREGWMMVSLLTILMSMFQGKNNGSVTSCKGLLAIKIFILVCGHQGGFLSYYNNQLVKFEEAPNQNKSQFHLRVFELPLLP